MAPRLYSYLRFSRPEQMKGDSQRRQLEKSQEWAARNNLTLDDSLDLRDLGVSAFRGKHAKQGALGLFLEAIKTGRVPSGSVLVVESLDRLSRQEIDDAYQQLRAILKAGVEVQTLEPEEHLTAADLNNPFKLIITITLMSRAHEESATKSKRLLAAWGNKRKTAGDRKLTAIAPAWLRLSKDRQQFEPIPDRVKVIRRIFRMSADGAGATAIVKRLNADSVPTFGKAKRRAEFWQNSYIKKILGNRAVLGEYQPHRMQDGKRVAAGEPLAGYFPSIIEEGDFYAAQHGKTARSGQGGRNGERVSNLFTGLLRDARDGSALTLANKGDGPTLVSSSARAGRNGSVYLSFPYPAFEQAMLIWGYDLPLSDVLPRKATNLEGELQKTEGRLADLDGRLAKVKSRASTAGDMDALLDLIVELQRERDETKSALERMKAEQSTPEGTDVEGLPKLIRAIKRAKGDELYGLRLKLRSLLKRLVTDIVVLVVQVNRDRLALADIEFKSGKRRRVTIAPQGRSVNLPAEINDLDVRQWKTWPEAMRELRFETVSDDAQQMMALEDAGLSRSEIAARLGTSSSQVSRIMRGCGRRLREKKKADAERLMTWHAAGNGWIKRHKGQRYFLGLRALAAIYPRRVKARTADGSWRAANAWWQSKLADLNTK